MKHLAATDITVTYTHTEGEPTCFVDTMRGGVIDWSPCSPASGMEGRLAYLRTHYDWLRCGLMLEPRGHADMFGAIVMPPLSAEASAGVIWMNPNGFRPQCGHGTIALGMLLVGQGAVGAEGDVARFSLDTLHGLIDIEVELAARQPIFCRYTSARASVVEQGTSFDTGMHGILSGDLVALGNLIFAIIRLPDGRIEQGRAEELRQIGREVQARMRTSASTFGKDSAVVFHHAGRVADHRTFVVFGDGQVDRSPGGTGTTALVASLEATGKARASETVTTEGILASGAFEATFTVDEDATRRRSIVAAIKGRSFITGRATWHFGADDPLANGFRLS